MTSMDSNMPNHLLMNLIYKHLREHGQEEAASVLRKHAPQVETAHAKVSLDDIFKRWINKKQKKNEEGKDFHKIGSKRSGSKSKSTKKNACSSTSEKAKGKSQIKATTQNEQSKIQKSTDATSLVKQTHRFSPVAENDSDSDSSLDVEKWKNVALHLSDAVIAKMDAFTNINSAKDTTSMQSKKRSSSSLKVKDQSTKKSKTSAKKTEASTALSSSQENTLSKPKSKSKFEKTTHSSTVVTPSKKTKDTGTTTNVSNDSLSHVVTPTTGVANIFSEVKNVKTKRVKPPKTESISDFETRNKSLVSENTGNHSELQTIVSPNRKTKLNKEQSSLVVDDIIAPTPSTKNKSKHVKTVESVDVGTPRFSDSVFVSSFLTSDPECSDSKTKTPSEKVKPKKSVKFKEIRDSLEAAGTCVVDSQLTPDFSAAFETPKKVKSKKSDKSAELKDDSDVLSNHSKPNLTETNKNLQTNEVKSVEPELVKTSTKKAKKSCLDLNDTETPSKKMDIHLSRVLFEGDQATCSLSETFISENSSKKSKSKKSSKADKEFLSEEVSVDTAGSVVANNELSISDNSEFSSKKRKRKRSGNLEQMPSSVTESEHDHSEMDIGHNWLGISTQSQGSSNPKEPKVKENITVSEETDAAEKDISPESKKRNKDKKKRKEKDKPVIEDVPQTSHEQEEDADSLQNKKKKKKKRNSDEEIPLLCTPAPEEYSSKKKKKSSKENGQNDAD